MCSILVVLVREKKNIYREIDLVQSRFSVHSHASEFLDAMTNDVTRMRIERYFLNQQYILAFFGLVAWTSLDTHKFKT